MKWHYIKQVFLCLMLVVVWYSGFYVGTRNCPEAQARAAIREQRAFQQKQEDMRVLIRTLEYMIAAEKERYALTNQ